MNNQATNLARNHSTNKKVTKTLINKMPTPTWLLTSFATSIITRRLYCLQPSSYSPPPWDNPVGYLSSFSSEIICQPASMNPWNIRYLINKTPTIFATHHSVPTNTPYKHKFTSPTNKPNNEPLSLHPSSLWHQIQKSFVLAKPIHHPLIHHVLSQIASQTD